VPSPRPVRGYSIEVNCIEFDEQDEDDGVWWGAEAGLTGNSVGVEHESREDLDDLLAGGRRGGPRPVGLAL
jgi:hypothetical protein